MTIREAFDWVWKIVVVSALVALGYEMGKWGTMWLVYLIMT